MDALKVWLEGELARVSGKSVIAAAIRYGLKHWDGLVRFVADGRIEMDTNAVERAITNAPPKQSQNNSYASATPLVTAAIPVAHMPVPHVKREAATRPAKVWRVEAKARQAHSPRAERTASSRAHSEPRSVAAVYQRGYAAVQ